MTQLEKLIKFTKERLAKARLTLSKLGEESIAARFKKSEANGGFSDYWRKL